MSGLEIKQKLRENGFSLNAIAKDMGMSPQNLQGILKPDDVRSGVIEKICTAINRPITFFYHVDTDNTIVSNNTTKQLVVGHDNAVSLHEMNEKFLEHLNRQQEITLNAQSQLSTAQEQITTLISKIS